MGYKRRTVPSGGIILTRTLVLYVVSKVRFGFVKDIQIFPQKVLEDFKVKSLSLDPRALRLNNTCNMSNELDELCKYLSTHLTLGGLDSEEYNLLRTPGQRHMDCWNFVDIMALQRPRAAAADPQLVWPADQEDDEMNLPSLSLSFLDNETSFELTSVNLFIYPRHPVSVVGKATIFTIEADSIPPEETVSVHLECPTGYLKKVFPKRDLTQPGRFHCSVRFKEHGTHTVIAESAGSRPARYEFWVTRNYSITSEVQFAKIGGLQGSGKGWGLAVHLPSNTVYAADRENHEILVLESSGKIRTRFGKHGNLEGRLFRPTGLAIDSGSERLYVTDKDNHRVAVYSLDGSFIHSFGRKGYQNGEFNYPWGITVSPKGDLVAVADSRNHRIQLFDAGGKFIRKYSVFETNPFEFKNLFDYPRGLAFSRDGSKIYVSDFNIHSVFVLEVESFVKTTLVGPGHLNRPQGLAVDQAGNILVADSKNNCVRVVTEAGELLQTLASSGSLPFTMPMDLAVFSDGRVVMTDAENRIRFF